MLSTPKAKGGLFLASSLCDGLEDNNIRQVTTLLLNKDADPNVLIPTHGVTPFHLVIGNDSIEFAEEVTKLFLRHGGDPNVKSIDGMTPVHVAAAWGRTNILQLLLANGGDPLCLDNDGRSPFHYAFDGKYFKVVAMLAKHCEYIQDKDDKPKYNMVLDKVFVTNGDVVAEYVASKDMVLDLGIDDIPRNNVLSNFYDCKSNSFPMFAKSNCVPDMYNINEIKCELQDNINVKCREDMEFANDAITSHENNLSQTNDKDVLNYSFVDLDFDFANLHLSDIMQKEKCLVSKIISHLSTTLTSDCTINETLHNYKKYKLEKSNSLASNSDMSFQLKENAGAPYEYRYHKSPKSLSIKPKHNHHKDILKPSTPSMRKQCSKYSTQTTSNKKYRKTSDRRIPLVSTCGLDNSIISMSPNFNTDNHRKRGDIIRTPLMLSHIHNDSIVSKSPNFATPVRTSRKRDIAKPLSIDDYVPSKVFKKFHEHKTQTQYSEFNRCKHIARSTPRRKKRSIYKCRSGKKRFDSHLQESDITADESTAHNTPRPINLDKSIFPEATEGVTRHGVLQSGLETLSSNFKRSLKMRRKNCYDNLAIKLDEGKYDEDDTMHSNVDMNSTHTDLDNSLNQMGKENEFIDSFDSDKSCDIKSENNRMNTLSVTDWKDRFKIEGASGTIDPLTNNVKSTCTTESNSSYDENFVNYVDCDTKKLSNENIDINISKNCNLYTKSWRGNRHHESSSCKLSMENNSYISVPNLPVKCRKQTHLSNCQGSYSSRTGENGTDSKRADDISKTKDLDVYRIEENSSLLSYVSAQEEYKYEDPEKGVILLERRLCVTPFSTLNGSECDVEKNKMAMSDASSVSTYSRSLPKELLFIDDVTLKRELTQLGDRPGPITNTTRRVYLKRLMHLNSIKNNNNIMPGPVPPRNITKNYAERNNRIKTHLEFGDWVNHLDTHSSLEKHVFQEFVSPNPSRRWREGTSKTCFTYLLLDPRVTQDLPCRSTHLKESEIWSIFLNAIFYIGKGKRSRPFAHLYDAFDIWISKTPASTNKKINYILDIWNNDYGVVCLHVFQNVIPVEAYTREAAMIDAMGIECLKNCKGGEYYGIAATWSMQQRQEFGRYLLYKALRILLHEGERQLFPQNL